MQPVFIGIAGASASGKSLLSHTIVKELTAELGQGCVAVMKEDAYYKDQSALAMEDRIKTNYDHPNAFDHSLLVHHLDVLRQSQSIEMPVYDYTIHTRSEEVQPLEPHPIIIVEGILLLGDKAIRKRLDTSIYVDTPLDICLIRRLKRDMEERGRTMESVITQYKKTVRPMFHEFVEPSKQFADLIVPRGGKNRVAIDMIKARVIQQIN